MPTEAAAPNRLRRLLQTIRAAHRRESAHWTRHMEGGSGPYQRR